MNPNVKFNLAFTGHSFQHIIQGDVTTSRLLQLHEGVKKSGIMGFYDPCPGEPKQLQVEYTYGGNRYEVLLSSLFSCMNIIAR